MDLIVEPGYSFALARALLAACRHTPLPFASGIRKRDLRMWLGSPLLLHSAWRLSLAFLDEARFNAGSVNVHLHVWMGLQHKHTPADAKASSIRGARDKRRNVPSPAVSASCFASSVSIGSTSPASRRIISASICAAVGCDTSSCSFALRRSALAVSAGP